jgi:hypothetical protein
VGSGVLEYKEDPDGYTDQNSSCREQQQYTNEFVVHIGMLLLGHVV